MAKKEKEYLTYLNCVYHYVRGVDGPFSTTMKG